MYEKYIDEFMPSKDMRDYLKTQELTPNQIAELIYKSPTPIDKKLSAFKSLKDETDNEELIELCQVAIELIYKANDIMLAEGVFCVHSYGISNADDPFYDGLFSNYNAIREYIAEENGQSYLYEIEKWIKDENGKLIEVCTYYSLGSRLCYFDLGLEAYKDKAVHFLHSDLILPTPFKAGDILQFRDLTSSYCAYSIVLSNRDKHDCCSLQNLYYYRCKWTTGAVLHGRVGFYNRDKTYSISPLYYVKRHKGDLSCIYEILNDVKAFIEADESNAEIIEKAVEATKYKGLTENKLRKIIERGE